MEDVANELGNGGCYSVWLLLERIGEAWDGSGPPELSLPEQKWRKIAQLSQRKFQKLIEIMQEHSMIFCSFEGKKMIIRADILLELKDEVTRKRMKNSGINPDAIRKSSGPDTDKESEIDKEQNTAAFNHQEIRNIASVLRQYGITFEMPRGKALLGYLKKHRPRNPAGYLAHILKINPGFNPQYEDAPQETPRGGGCRHISEVIKTMRLPDSSGGL